MSVAAFRTNLLKKAIGPGSRWLKADFHVHLPGSSDYQYKEGDAVERFGRTLAEGNYSFAIVLKHQEFPTRSELEAIQPYCPATTLIPGAEINVFVDALFKKVGKDHFFHCIVAVDPNSTGDYNFVLQKARQDLTYKGGEEYPAGFRSSITDVGKFFRSNGALFIPAHLHQSKSPDESRSIDDIYDDDAFLDFISDGAFDALEVRSESTAAFFDGKKKTELGREIPSTVCVSSSDAHHHNALANTKRATWIQAEAATFAELEAALNFRHRVSLRKPEPAHSRVVGVHIVGSFLPDAWIDLNEGLNALIGAKGSGKTAIVESIRFALNTYVPPERRDSVDRHVNHVLGSSGYVECLISHEGREALITRRADSPSRITILDASGDTKSLDAAEPIAFPVSILGWHEIEAVADHASARINLLDRTGDAGAIRALYAAIDTQVESARDQLPMLQRDVKKLEAKLRTLWQLRRKRETLSRLEQTDLTALQQEYEWFLSAEQNITGFGAAVGARMEQLPNLNRSGLALEVPLPPDTERAAPLREALQRVETAISENASAESAMTDAGRKVLNAVSDAERTASETIANAFAVFRDEIYTPRVNSLPAEDREILTRQIQVLEETKLLPVVERECTTLLAAARALALGLKTTCEKIVGLRTEIAEKRQALVDSLNNELRLVKLTFLRSANKSAFSQFQERHGAGGTSVLGFVNAFGMQSSYENLAVLFQKLADLDPARDQWDTDALIYDVRLVEFLDAFDDDDMDIALEVGKAGFVSIQNLSAGQRSVAVFPLLLRNTRGPLMIDQPEDNLDNRYIADTIGPDLLDRKASQQFVVTSHNANLVVLTDADLIVHVDSDGKTASFPAAGFFSCPASDISKSVLDVLDGGQAALKARQRKYGLQMQV